MGLEEQVDQVWGLLKSFSLCTVRGGAASMHRLLQANLRANQVRLARAWWALRRHHTSQHAAALC